MVGRDFLIAVFLGTLILLSIRNHDVVWGDWQVVGWDFSSVLFLETPLLLSSGNQEVARSVGRDFYFVEAKS